MSDVEVCMRSRGIVAVGFAAALTALFATVPHELAAQGGAALTGVVSSEEEGKMEGVVVSARADAANFSVSVVSDAQGKYSFPHSHLTPGAYTLSTRAVGYDLVDPGSVTVTAGKAATRDLKLEKTKDLPSQLS